ncbi:MAG: radical SAM protein [Anaerolineales bacterium]|jgi:MoaA/NifB/PqqE/SkfB family radical SAM enzyme
MIGLNGLHILLTYQCNFECDHCFVWGSPWQNGTLTLAQIRHTLAQACDLGTIEWIYFEGGEPFLYYPILVESVEMAADQGFKVGIVSNSYWANSEEDALEWLSPFKGRIQDLSVSGDLFHWDSKISHQVKNAITAAEQLDIPIGVISIAQPVDTEASSVTGQLPAGESGIMYRGRAAEKLASKVNHHPWTQFTTCPYEELSDPGRVHLDPFGNLHICQGISMGNIFQKPLKEICETYDPEQHPITSVIIDGGPTELVRHFKLPHDSGYADACHLCYDARHNLRAQYPDILTPDQVYGVF